MLSQPAVALSLADIGRHLQVNKSTCYSMMTALTRVGWVTRDPIRKVYVLGPAMIDIGRKATDGFPTFRIARPAMSKLSFSLGVNCSAVRAADGKIILIEQVKDLRSAWDPFIPGVDFVLEAPVGAYFIAYESAEVIEDWMGPVTTAKRRYLLGVLEQCRRKGFLVEKTVTDQERMEASRIGAGSMEKTVLALQEIVRDREEYYLTKWSASKRYDVHVIGSPIVGRSGTVELLLTLSGFKEALTGSHIDAMAEALCAVTTSLTAAASGR